MRTPEQEKLQQELYERLWPILTGHDPLVQGAVLADLAARWVVAYAPDEREAALTKFTSMVRELTALHAVHLRGEGQPQH